MVKKKVTHKYNPDEQARFVAFAIKSGNTSQTTTALQKKFGISAPAAYYYRRLAFGYYRGRKLPVAVYLSAECVESLDGLLKAMSQEKVEALRKTLNREQYIEAMIAKEAETHNKMQ